MDECMGGRMDGWMDEGERMDGHGLMVRLID